MLFNGKSGRKWVVRRSGRPTDKREKERPKGPQPYIYNMYRDWPECRYAIYNGIFNYEMVKRSPHVIEQNTKTHTRILLKQPV